MTKPLRVLACVPHFFRRTGEAAARAGAENGSSRDTIRQRAGVFTYCLEHLTAQLRPARFVIGTSGESRTHDGDETGMDQVQPIASPTVGSVIVNTVRDDNLLDQIEHRFIRAYVCQSHPRLLGYRCRARFAQHLDDYDLFCFVEDDTAILDPRFFLKARAFYDRFGEDCVLLPSRYELTSRFEAFRSHLDGPLMTRHRVHTRTDAPPELLAEDFTGPLRFVLTESVLAGCYVLTRSQIRRWMGQEDFAEPVPALLRQGYDPLEMTQIPMMASLPIYRPAPENIDWLEVHHVPNRLSMAQTPGRRIIRLLEERPELYG